MAKPNYKQIYAIKASREKKIREVCPGIPDAPGIYIFYRIDEAGIRRSYCGQATVSLCERCAAHLGEYDHIALSLKKHGFYSEDNPYGWKLSYKTYPRNELDEHEIATIKALADQGYQMYNVTAGGQGKGKLVTGDYKQPKTYREGIAQGRKNLAKELSDIIDKHLVVSIKPDKVNNKVSIRQYQKFKELLENERGETNKEN